MVDKMALVQVSVQALGLTPLNIITAMPHIHLRASTFLRDWLSSETTLSCDFGM
jgi:hypothetical protein